MIQPLLFATLSPCKKSSPICGSTRRQWKRRGSTSPLSAAIPLFPYFLGVPEEHRFTVAIIGTAVALVLLGAARSYVTKEKMYRGPLEIVFVGALGAIVAYGVGVLFKSAVGVAL